MENKRFLTTQDVMEMLGVSLSYSYKLIRMLNAELERELERIEKASDMDGELLTPIRSMLEILEGFKEQPGTLADMKKLTVPNEE